MVQAEDEGGGEHSAERQAPCEAGPLSRYHSWGRVAGGTCWLPTASHTHNHGQDRVTTHIASIDAPFRLHVNATLDALLYDWVGWVAGHQCSLHPTNGGQARTGQVGEPRQGRTAGQAASQDRTGGQGSSLALTGYCL